MMYIVFTFKERNILAIPLENNYIRKNGYKFYKGETIRRRIVRMVIKLLIQFNVEEIAGYKTNNPVPVFTNFNLESW